MIWIFNIQSKQMQQAVFEHRMATIKNSETKNKSKSLIRGNSIEHGMEAWKQKQAR